MRAVNALLVLFLFGGQLLSQTTASGSAEDYYQRGMRQVEQLETSAAIPYFDKAISINPTFAMAYAKRGWCKALQADLGGARADFDKAIELNPKLGEPYYYRAELNKLKVSRGDLDEALTRPTILQDLTTAIQNDPRLPGPYYARGFMLMNADQAKAKLDFDKVIDLKPNKWVAFAYLWRGQIEMKQGKDSEAERDFSECLKLAPEMKEDVDELRKETTTKRSKPQH